MFFLPFSVEIEKMRKDMEEEIRAQLEANQMLLQDNSQTWESKVRGHFYRKIKFTFFEIISHLTFFWTNLCMSVINPFISGAFIWFDTY